MTDLVSVLKSTDITLPTKVHIVKAMVFPVVHVQMWEQDNKKGWVPKNQCLWTVMLEKTLESSLDCKEIKPINPKGNQPWIFIGRTDVETEALILGHLMQRTDSLEKTLMLGKIEGRRIMTEDEMVGWQHWLDGHEFEQAPEVGDGQGSLACCSPWGCKESDMTERLNWTDHTVFSSPYLSQK